MKHILNNISIKNIIYFLPIFMFISCSSIPNGEQFIGTWYKNENPKKYFPMVMEISKKGDLFKITTYSIDKSKTPKDKSKKSRVAPYKDGYIEFSPIDRLIYLEEDNTLHLNTTVYHKLSNTATGLDLKTYEFKPTIVQ